MAVKIFAKYGTSERIAVRPAMGVLTQDLQADLEAKFGGRWLYVQDLVMLDYLLFTASKDYLGFDNNPDNDYCGNFVKAF